MSTKQDFIWAVRQTLLEQLKEKSPLLEMNTYEYKKNIIENMSDEKLYSIGKHFLSEGDFFANLSKQIKNTFNKTKNTFTPSYYKKIAAINNQAVKRYNDMVKSGEYSQAELNNALKQIQKARNLMHKSYVNKMIPEAKPLFNKVKQNQLGILKTNVEHSKKVDVPNAHDLDSYAKNTLNYFKSPEGKQTLKYGGLALLGTAALGIAANYIYKRFFSQAAKACNHLSGPEKTLCMKKFEKQAIQKTIQKLQSDMKACNKSDNPQKCQINLRKQIMKWQEKMARV